jgi:hypothetical protein
MQTQRLGFFVAAVIAAGGVCGRALAAPVTLAAPTTGRIIAFAQDGRQIAWIGYRERVHVKTIATGRSEVVGTALAFNQMDGSQCYPGAYKCVGWVRPCETLVAWAREA